MLAMKFVVFVVAASCTVWAQTASPPPASVETLQKRIDSLNRMMIDWAGLTKYGSDDSEVPPPAPGENRVVFLGDQLTEYWGKTAGAFFAGKPYFNRGISGQNTAMMLVRFRQDVLSLKPKVVVIQGGGNDMAAIGGIGTEGTIMENLASLVELGKLHGIKVVLTSITPVNDYYLLQTATRPLGKIRSINASIRGFATDNGLPYVNYYAVLQDEDLALKKEFTADGAMLNAAGYGAIAAPTEDAIAKALAIK